MSTGIKSLTIDDGDDFHVEENCIYMKKDIAMQGVRLYTLDSRLVYKGENERIKMTKGIYLLATKGETYKVVIP